MTALLPAEVRLMRKTAGDLSISERWEELLTESDQLARLAGLKPETQTIGANEFAAQLEALQGWQREMIAQAIEDILAMLRPGLQALHTVRSRGGNTRPAALALWREFHEAREGALALIGLPDHPENPG